MFWLGFGSFVSHKGCLDPFLKHPWSALYLNETGVAVVIYCQVLIDSSTSGHHLLDKAGHKPALETYYSNVHD